MNTNTKDLFNLNITKEKNEERIIKTISKSDLFIYEQCPLKLWKKNKNPEKYYNTPIKNRNTLIGIRAHEIIAKDIAKEFLNKKIKFSNRIKDASVKFEAEKIAKNFLDFLKNEIIQNGEVIGVEEKVESRLDELDITLKGIIDLLAIKENNYGAYIHVVDFKRKFFKEELDNEALIYSYIVGQIYNLPVLFERISIEDKKTFQYFFHFEDLKMAKEDIIEYIAKILDELEQEEEPIKNPSIECSSCPFYKECLKEAEDKYEEIKLKGVNNPKEIVRAIQELKTIEIFRKELEDLLKKYLIENSIDKIEFDDLGMEVVLNISKYASLGRKIKKADIVPKLLKANVIPEEKYSLFSIKIDDFLDEIKEVFDLKDNDIKYIERKSLSVKSQKKRKDKKNEKK